MSLFMIRNSAVRQAEAEFTRRMRFTGFRQANAHYTRLERQGMLQEFSSYGHHFSYCLTTGKSFGETSEIIVSYFGPVFCAPLQKTQTPRVWVLQDIVPDQYLPIVLAHEGVHLRQHAHGEKFLAYKTDSFEEQEARREEARVAVTEGIASEYLTWRKSLRTTGTFLDSTLSHIEQAITEATKKLERTV